MAENSRKTAGPSPADHLKKFRWGKGDPSPNPGGRPKRRPISDRYERLMEVPLLEKERKRLKLEKGATFGDALALGQVEAAIKGRTEAAREIREAIEGKAVSRIEVPLKIEGVRKGQWIWPAELEGSGPEVPIP